jgi:hypothetical protein
MTVIPKFKLTARYLKTGAIKSRILGLCAVSPDGLNTPATLVVPEIVKSIFWKDNLLRLLAKPEMTDITT